MRAFIYWILLASVIGFLAYLSFFSVIPFIFLAGGAVLGLTYTGFLLLRQRRTGTWQHSTYQSRFHGVLFTYVVVFWTVLGVFTNVREQQQLWAKYEPYYSEDGSLRGYTFHYVEYPGSWERVESEELNRYIRANHPEQVRLTIEISRDFGKLRGYAVQGVDGIAVNEAWSEGSPPWEGLRSRKADK